MNNTKEEKRHWGFYQKKCHKYLEQLFDTRKEAYKWLSTECKVQYFSLLNPKTDFLKLREIHDKLLVKEIFNK